MVAFLQYPVVVPIGPLNAEGKAMRKKRIDWCLENAGARYNEWDLDTAPNYISSVTFVFRDNGHATLFALKWL